LKDGSDEVLGELVTDKYGQGIFPNIPDDIKLRIKYSLPGSSCSREDSREYGTMHDYCDAKSIKSDTCRFQVVLVPSDFGLCCKRPCSDIMHNNWMSDEFDVSQRYPVTVKTERPGMTVELVDSQGGKGSCEVLDTAVSDETGRATFKEGLSPAHGGTVLFRDHNAAQWGCDQVEWWYMEKECSEEQMKTGKCEVSETIPVCTEPVAEDDDIVVELHLESIEAAKSAGPAGYKAMMEAAQKAALPDGMTMEKFAEDYAPEPDPALAKITDANGDPVAMGPEMEKAKFPIVIQHTFKKKSAMGMRRRICQW